MQKPGAVFVFREGNSAIFGIGRKHEHFRSEGRIGEKVYVVPVGLGNAVDFRPGEKGGELRDLGA